MSRINDTSVGEEIFNAITHGVGALAGIIGFVFLIIHAYKSEDPYRFWGFLIFGVTLILLYLTSTLFHSLIFTRAKKVFKTLDYSAIALFIAGSYTPIALIPLRNYFGWALLVGVWLLALGSIVWRIFQAKREIISLVLYLLSGWLIIFFIKPLIQQVSPSTLILLVVGGLCYTIGTIFFRWKNLAYAHGIWHLFVLGGSMCHFMVMISL